MTTIQEIRSAIAGLSLEERAELTSELCGWADDESDEQMKRDAALGTFASLNKEADAAHASGNTTGLGKILEEA
ncbi:MAG TPA: hypothetical protein VGR78_13420 [Verrucomicrobiae bacterium]|nr:hypothetical protein [Verrucomicrobiae bacterium]